MQVTVAVKLLPTKIQDQYLVGTSKNYVDVINCVCGAMLRTDGSIKLSSKDILIDLPSALKNQAIRDGKSLFFRSRKLKKQCIAKKPVCIWNNQNYKIRIDESNKRAYISFPVFIDGKSRRIEVVALISDYQIDRLQGASESLENKFGTMRIVKKANKWLAQIAVNIPEPKNKIDGDKKMGVDLGLKVPAVAVTETGETRFFGNGRQNKYERRRQKSIRTKLGKDKKLKAIKKNKDKEQRWMRDQDHKISRSIVNFALKKNVSKILLEGLEGIRSTARTSRKNAKNLHMWSFYRLARFIEYKARIAGIKVEYVDPRDTSKTCPKCKTLNRAIDRRYRCECGFKTHRDRVGAMNIIHATVVDGVMLL